MDNQSNLQKLVFTCNFTATLPRFTMQDTSMDFEFKKKYGIDDKQAETVSRTWVDQLGDNQYRLKEIMSLTKKARACHKSYVVCSVGNAQYGDDLIPNALMGKHAEDMEGWQNEYVQLVEDFLNDYEQISNDAVAFYNGAIAQDAFPSVDEVRSRFTWKITRKPLPDSNSVDGMLGSRELEEQIKEEVREEQQQTFNKAVNGLHDQIKSMIKNIHNQASGKKAINESTLDNLARLLDRFPSLNISGCPKLAKAYEDAKQLLKYDATETGDQAVKDELTGQSQKIINDLSKFYGG